MGTYGLVLDAVDRGVEVLGSKVVLSQVVLDLANLKDTGLLEGPGSQLLGEFLVGRAGLLFVAGRLDGRGEPLVLETLDGAEQGEARGCTGLHGGDESQLRAGGPDILSRRQVFLRVIAVGSRRSAQDRRNESVVAERVRSGPWQSQDTLPVEESLGIGSQWAGALEEKDIVLFGRRQGIVVEVVDNDRRTVGSQVKIEFQKQRADGAGSGGLAREREEDVTVLVHKVDDVLGAQRRSKSWSHGQLHALVANIRILKVAANLWT